MSQEQYIQQATAELATVLNTKETRRDFVRALAGDGNGVVDVPGRALYIYARLAGDDSRLVQAYNISLSLAEDIPIQLLKRYDHDRVVGYEVSALATDVEWPGWTPIAYPPHAHSHMLDGSATGGWDPVFVYERMFISLRVQAQATPGLTVKIQPGYYNIDGQEYYYAGGSSPAMTPPVSGIRYDVVCLNATGTISIEAGALTTPPLTFTFSTAGLIPLAAILLSVGQTAIVEANIYDTRPFNSIATPGAAGPAGGDLSGTYPNPTVKQSSVPFAFTADITPAQINSADVNDYAPNVFPDILSLANVIRLSSSGNVDFTGLSAGYDGRIFIIYNTGGDFGGGVITLKDENAGSAAANRFALSADIALNVDDACIVQYDSTTQRWRVIAVSRPVAVSTPHNLLDGVIAQDTVAHVPVLGDVIYGNATPKWQALAGQITATRKFLRQTGTGTVSAVPAWDTVADSDVPATIVRTSRLINTTAPITGGGDLSEDITITLANTAVTPGTYGDATDVAQFTVDAQGRLTAASNVPITGSGGGGGDVGHEHGLDRYAASSGQTVFDLTSYASQIELCSDNGSIIDPQTYTLSADGSQVTMDSGITVAHVVTINYILVAI